MGTPLPSTGYTRWAVKLLGLRSGAFTFFGAGVCSDAFGAWDSGAAGQADAWVYRALPSGGTAFVEAVQLPTVAGIPHDGSVVELLFDADKHVLSISVDCKLAFVLRSMPAKRKLYP